MIECLNLRIYLFAYLLLYYFFGFSVAHGRIKGGVNKMNGWGPFPFDFIPITIASIIVIVILLKIDKEEK